MGKKPQMSEITSPEMNSSYSEGKKDFILYRYRFVIGVLFILIANNSLLMMTIFSPLQTTLSTVYDQSITFINFGTFLIFSVCYVPANFLANYIYGAFGVRIGLLTGGFLTVGGLWIRCLSRHGFIWIFIGQMLGGIGQPFFFCSPPKLANIWFGVHERTLATTVLLISLSIGTILSSYLPQYFVNINADNTTILDQTAQMNFWFALFGSFSLALVLIFMREKPPTPPSKAGAAVKYNYLDSLKTLVRDRNTMMLIASTSIVWSAGNIYFATSQQIAENFNINGDLVGDILSISSLFSMIGAITITPIFNRYRRFNFFLITICVSSLVVLVGSIFATQSENVYVLGAVVIIYFTITGPLLPISVDYFVDLSFPVAEFTSSGLWYAILAVSTTIGSLIIDQIISADPSTTGGTWGLVIIVIYQIIGTIPLFWVKENLKRTKYEQEGTLDPVLESPEI